MADSADAKQKERQKRSVLRKLGREEKGTFVIVFCVASSYNNYVGVRIAAITGREAALQKILLFQQRQEERLRSFKSARLSPQAFAYSVIGKFRDSDEHRQTAREVCTSLEKTIGDSALPLYVQHRVGGKRYTINFVKMIPAMGGTQPYYSGVRGIREAFGKYQNRQIDGGQALVIPINTKRADLDKDGTLNWREFERACILLNFWKLDTDGDGTLSPEEQRIYLDSVTIDATSARRGRNAPREILSIDGVNIDATGDIREEAAFLNASFMLFAQQ